MTDLFLSRLDIAPETNVGKKREKNEDFVRVFAPPPASPQERWGMLCIVADGMGGLGGGDFASRSAVEEILRQYYADSDEPAEPAVRLQQAIQAANSVVRDQASKLGLRYIGTTAAGLVLMPSGDVIAFNVGDVRGMIDGVRAVLSEKRKRVIMGRNARLFAETQSWPAMMDELIVCYDDLIRGRVPVM